MGKNELIIIESQYFPTINWINILFLNKDIKIDLCETYQKMSFRNRCVVAGSNGLVHLSVPLQKGRSQRQPMKDVKISYATDWQLQHWRTIESCYGRSPFFEFYRDWLEAFYKKQPVFLADMNLEILEWVCKQTGLEKSWEVLDRETDYPIDPRAIDLRGYFMPKNFQSPERCPHPIVYTQVFEDRIGFQPNLSVLDLLCCTGPQARLLLQNSNFFPGAKI
ncbi:WbqC family protein [Asinibacterium sp. OR53]|uniref:WbqC family protein n=1 Tax=Asinibacterium sp. OR53 TaxID=925409 RepID=UPI0004B3D271|nr:WbqC family protein [Asinibacterium sp. OR53]